jgi:catechol 2,3-dioxygenase-like lactoylglutathione lyase family enzyme
VYFPLSVFHEDSKHGDILEGFPTRDPITIVIMIKTRGLTHLSLYVADPDRSLAFYARAFGVREYYRDANSIQVLGPGKYDVIAFEKDPRKSGKRGGIAHFGFRLQKAGDIEKAVQEATAAGGKILDRGEFSPGFPFVFISDPDGYVIEIWYE